MIAPVVYQYAGYGTGKCTLKTKDIFFDAEAPRSFQMMGSRLAPVHWGTNLHPLMSLLMFTPAQALRLAGLGELQALWGTMALLSGVWAGLLFALLVLWGCRLLDAAIFTVLGAVSASAMFWFSVVDVFAFGSVTILAALIFTIWPARASPVVRYSAAVAMSLSMTVTNVMVGLIATARRLPPKDWWTVGVNAWFVVTMLWGIQKVIFPTSDFFLPPMGTWQGGRAFAWSWSYLPTFPRIWEAGRAQLFHAMIMPEVTLLSSSEIPPGFLKVASQIISVQNAGVGSSGALGSLATVAWVLLAMLGGLTAAYARSGLGALCGLILAAQVLFHLVFGWETFLYTMHILPLLVVVVAGVTLTRLRTVGLALAVIVIVLGGINNWTQFQRASAMVSGVDAEARACAGT
jgi:hypothetical protein